MTIVSRALTGGRAARAPYLTEEELLTLLHVSEEQGVIEEQEHQMIHGIIEIGDKTVREIMVPRTDIVAVEKSAHAEGDRASVFKEHRHTRLPVYEGDIDHVVGLIHTKDLLLFYTLSQRAEVRHRQDPAADQVHARAEEGRRAAARDAHRRRCT